MSSILDVLNKEQQLAVKTVDGPVIVYAGAGTGKTKTLTARIAYMVLEHGIKPYNILAITFTKKATAEMKERLEMYLLDDARFLHVSTIHSLCVYILRRSIDLIGYTKNFEIIDDEDALKIINNILKESEEKKVFNARGLQAEFSSFKNGCGIIAKSHSEIFTKYEEVLKKNNSLDFDDLLIKTKELLTSKSNILNYYQDLFKYILVDEFQDTNVVQYEVIRLLSGKYNNLFVVGDDDQSIYSFRGATVENMQGFTTDYPDAVKVILNENYRSSNVILEGANNLINENQNRTVKNLYSNIIGDSDDISIQQAFYYDNETQYVIHEIKDLVNDGYCEYSDIAVLYRNSALSHIYETTFMNENIPYNIYGGFSYLKRKEIKDIISYLRFIIDPTREGHFKRIFSINPHGIGDKTIQKVIDIKVNKNINILEAITIFYESSPTAKNQYLIEFRDMIQDLIDHVNEMNIVDFYDYLLERTGYFDYLRQEDLDNNSYRADNVKEFKSFIYNISHDNSSEDLDNIDILRLGIDNLLLDQSIDETEKANALTLSTIHSVKGLEFKVVFVVALEEGIFPSLREDAEIEEERRVAYVAFTRAKSKLYLTCSQKRLIYGRFVMNNPSRFIKEFIGTTKKNNTGMISEDISEQKEKDTSSLTIGCKVNHKYFGIGTVVNIDDRFIQIIFEKDNSIKKIKIDYDGITVIK